MSTNSIISKLAALRMSVTQEVVSEA